MIELGLVGIGLLGLWAGTELVIGGATKVARQYGLSELFVGLVILSIGSDLPEIAVAVNSGIRTLQGKDASGVVIGSSIGSAFGQIGLVLGITGLAGYLALPRRYVYRHGAALLGSIVFLAFTGWNGVVTRLEGFILVASFVIYLLLIFIEERRRFDKRQPIPGNIIKAWIGMAIGMLVVIASSDVTVNAATDLAERWGVAQTLVAIILIGIGTSLPELTISVGALLKKKSGMSVGNIIGSNVLDTLVPIGLAALISTLSFDSILLRFDLPALFLLSLVVLVFFIVKRGLQKWEASIILSLYFGYIIIKIEYFG
jgi:cation:H+ antiporter